MTTKTKPRGILLHSWEQSAAARGGLGVVVRPCKEQPQVSTDGDAAWWDKSIQAWRNSRQYARDCSPLGPVGSVLYVKERYWVRNHGNMFKGTGIDYAAGGDSHHLGYRPKDRGKLCCWRSARSMPHWAARTWLKHTGSTVKRLAEISEEEAMSAGVIVLQGCDDDFAQACLSDWLRKRYPGLTDDSYVWLSRVEMVKETKTIQEVRA